MKITGTTALEAIAAYLKDRDEAGLTPDDMDDEERMESARGILAALSQAEPAGVAGQEGADKREQLRQEVLRLFKANKMANDESLANLIADYFAALSPAPAGVQAKALEWQEGTRKTLGYGLPITYWRAATVFDWGYRIENTGRAYRMDGRDFPTLEAAKAAAQADYETRIRSALIAPPAAGAQAVPVDLAGLNYVIQYRRKDDGIHWINMAAFDVEGAAERYCKDCQTANSPWEYRMVPVPSSPVGEER